MDGPEKNKKLFYFINYDLDFATSLFAQLFNACGYNWDDVKSKITKITPEMFTGEKCIMIAPGTDVARDM